MTTVLAIDADNLGALINYTIVLGTSLAIALLHTYTIHHVICIYLGNTDDVFEIQSNGLIITASDLDRETRSRYILTVEVCTTEI